MSGSTSTAGGIGLFGALFLVLLVLKLTAVIDFSWWWVTAPLWGPLALFIVVMAGLLLSAWATAAAGKIFGKGG